MRVMTSQTTGKSTVCSTACSGYKQSQIQILTLLTLCGLAPQKASNASHDIIIEKRGQTRLSSVL